MDGELRAECVTLLLALDLLRLLSLLNLLRLLLRALLLLLQLFSGGILLNWSHLPIGELLVEQWFEFDSA